MNISHSHSPAAVRAAGLELSYGASAILRGIDFSLEKGKTLALLGPSGCGKTTLLRLVAGLLAPTRGAIDIAGRAVADAATKTFVPPERRGLGMVFQDYALWPHLNVGRNVSFPLEMRGLGKAERESRTKRALERVGLGAYADRRPSDLSGGQQQRVAIARAIVAEPELILFDEPLSNLDRELRDNMVGEIAGLISGLGLTAIYVTHDHAEALTLADEVAVMRAGMIEQLASPDRLVDAPATPEVAEFLRLGCLAEAERRGAVWFLKGSDIAIGEADAAGRTARVLIPVASISTVAQSPDGLSATVLRSQFRGDGHLASVSLAGLPGLELQVLSRARLRPGEGIGLSIDPAQIRWFQDTVQMSKQEKLENV
ncbi:ABC transporter ATP-binding protein [Rhizobium sp. BK251]|uniref:ABC transporter ATP-binding protein n=1 Tax=Rhizobium sp. BK251 TaxID=2512125 RepID=UPI001048EC53|nr:ABC transporter ATP-binding protein [Rhizobium sp. BK251]TCL68324.1 iron(III) transport system ATP-binding protein [Rhizobium sp. BK251]